MVSNLMHFLFLEESDREVPFCSLCILMISFMNLNSLGLFFSGMHSLMLMTLPC